MAEASVFGLYTYLDVVPAVVKRYGYKNFFIREIYAAGYISLRTSMRWPGQYGTDSHNKNKQNTNTKAALKI